MTIEQRCYNVYSIDEHPNPDACFDWMRIHWSPCEHEVCEVVDTLKAFCAHFDIDLRDYAISDTGDRGEFVSVSVPADLEDMQGVRLWKYIQAHYQQLNGRPLLDGNCPFTGVCWDEDALDPMREFIARPDGRDWQTLADDCIASLIAALHQEAEYRYSDEALREDCEANDYLFTETGEAA